MARYRRYVVSRNNSMSHHWMVDRGKYQTYLITVEKEKVKTAI